VVPLGTSASPVPVTTAGADEGHASAMTSTMRASRERPRATQGTVGGDGKQRVHGTLPCGAARSAIRRWGEAYTRTRVFVADEATAIAAGFRPRGNCMRKQYAKWKARQQDGSTRSGRATTTRQELLPSTTGTPPNAADADGIIAVGRELVVESARDVVVLERPIVPRLSVPEG
jgi:hypothetical protein